jgi:hypothetical protein
MDVGEYQRAAREAGQVCPSMIRAAAPLRCPAAKDPAPHRRELAHHRQRAGQRKPKEEHLLAERDPVGGRHQRQVVPHDLHATEFEHRDVWSIFD